MQKLWKVKDWAKVVRSNEPKMLLNLGLINSRSHLYWIHLRRWHRERNLSRMCHWLCWRSFINSMTSLWVLCLSLTNFSTNNVTYQFSASKKSNGGGRSTLPGALVGCWAISLPMSLKYTIWTTPWPWGPVPQVAHPHWCCIGSSQACPHNSDKETLQTCPYNSNKKKPLSANR